MTPTTNRSSDPGQATTTRTRETPHLGRQHPVHEEPPHDHPDYPPGNVTPIRPNPQHNLPAERALLGAILLEPRLATSLLELVDPDDFYDPKHELIWESITRITTTDGVDPDPILITDDLRRSGHLPKTHEVLLNAPAACPAPNQATTYANLVHNAATARRTSAALTRAQQQIDTSTADTLPYHLAEAMQVLDDLVSGHTLSPTTNGGLRDLSWLLDGTPPTVAPPAYVHRDNGHALFYAGRVNGIYGDPEAAKSWLAQLGIIQALEQGNRAALIDVDHNGAVLTMERLILLGAHPEQLADPDQFRYLEPEDGDDLRAAVTQLVTWQPDYVVLDSIGEMMPMLGVKSVDNDELSSALRTIATALAQTGACVVTIDHLPKGNEARTSGFAIGGTAKKRAIDGAYIHAEAKTPPAPGKVGRIVLRIEKDRPGRLRATCAGKYIGTFILDSSNDHTTASIAEETVPTSEAGTRRYTIFMEKISRYVEDNDQATFNDICDAVQGTEKHIRAAIKTLIDEGFMSTFPGPRRSRLHHSIAHYREAEDDQL